MKALMIAIQFMTRLPLPHISYQPRDMAQAIRWFPAAGLLVGFFVAGGAWAGLHRDPWGAALLATITWVGVTGGLHLDGLGDIADAAGAAHGDRGRLNAVLADPHIGSFGVTAIVLQLATKLVLLRLALDVPSLTVLAVIPMAARVGPLVWVLTLPPLHPGLGTAFGKGANWSIVAAWSIPVFAAAWFLGPAILAMVPATALWGVWLRRRIGGISGDGHGAVVELAETAMLAALAFA